MRDFLLAHASAQQWEIAGFWVLVTGLVGEILGLFIPHDRSKLYKSFTTVCVVAIIAGVWLEKFGAEEERAARRLTAETRQLLAPELKKLEGTQFVLLVSQAAEPLDFGLDIADALKSAGWEWQDSDVPGLGIGLQGKPIIGTSILSHVEVQPRGGTSEETARALIAALKRLHLKDVRLGPTRAGPDGQNSGVRVIIGNKH